MPNQLRNAEDAAKKQKLIIGVVLTFVIASAACILTQLTQVITRKLDAPVLLCWLGQCSELPCFIFPLFLNSCFTSPPPETDWRLLTKWAFILCFFTLGTSFFGILALKSISSTMYAALTSTSPVWNAVFSFCILDFNLNYFTFAALIFAIAGVCLESIPKIDNVGKLDGIIFSLLTTSCTAFTVVLFKYVFPLIHLKQIFQLISIRSGFGFIITLPIWICFKEYGVQPFDFKDLRWDLTIVFMFTSLMFDFSICAGVRVTYPLFISISALVCIPMNGVVDYFAYGIIPTWLDLLGFVSIIAAFITLLIQDWFESKEKDTLLQAPVENDPE